MTNDQKPNASKKPAAKPAVVATVIEKRPAPPVDPAFDYTLAIVATFLAGPFAVAVSLVGCAAAIKAARLLWDTASTLGAAP